MRAIACQAPSSRWMRLGAAILRATKKKYEMVTMLRAVIRSVYGFILRRGATVELRPAF